MKGVLSDEEEALRERRMMKLVGRLPGWLSRRVHWLLEPSRRWVRIPAGVVFMIGGVLSFLPVLGLWMLPLGFLLLAEDVPLFRVWSARMLAWVEREHPGWLGEEG